MSNPVGFWSYARSDDAHSDGHLSQLRTIVGKAIALQHGADIQIWQDIQAIPPGADWAAHIERTISHTVFFIPILTPRYLKSKNCLEELQSFRRRMEELGRDDIIFPIQYVNVDNVDREDSVFGAEFDALHRHQWSDFRSLRHADPRSNEVHMWVDNLAAHILQVAVPVSKAENANLAARQRETKVNPVVRPAPEKAADESAAAKRADDQRKQEDAARAADEARRRQAAAAAVAAEAAEQTIAAQVFMPQTAVVALDPATGAMFGAAPRVSGTRKPHTGLFVALGMALVVVCVAAWFAITRQQAARPAQSPSDSTQIVPPPTPVVPPPALVVPPPPAVVPAPVPANASPAPASAQQPASAADGLAVPARAPDLQGSVDKMLDSAALIVGGRIVNLYGVRGVDGRPAKAMQRYLESEGNVIQCYARDEAYQCFANGRDIAAHALRSGWARARQGVPSPYSTAEQDARLARTGIWGK